MPLSYNFKKKIEGSHGDGIWTLAWCQDNLVTGSLEGSIKLWNLADTQHPVFTSKKTRIGVTSVVTLQDGSMAIACYQDSSIRFFDLINKQETAMIEPSLILDAYSLSLAPGEDILVSGNAEGSINIWSMQEKHEKVATIPTDSPKLILNTAFSIDGKLASSSVDGLVNVIDMNTQQKMYKFDLHHMPCRQIAFAPEGDLLYSASDDRMVHLYDLRTGECIQTFGHESMVYCLDVAQDGRHFLTGSTDGKVSLWDIGMQKRLQRFEGPNSHQDVVWDVGFQRGGNLFASVSDDATVHLYEQQ